MKVLHWRLPSGYEGHGSPLPDDLADAWLAALNKGLPDMTHWLVDAPGLAPPAGKMKRD